MGERPNCDNNPAVAASPVPGEYGGIQPGAPPAHGVGKLRDKVGRERIKGKKDVLWSSLSPPPPSNEPLLTTQCGQGGLLQAGSCRNG